MTEIGWKDQHGDTGHVLLDRERVREYAPPRLGEAWLAEDVVGIIEIQPEGSAITHPVYLPRAIAEILHNALAAALSRDDDSTL